MSKWTTDRTIAIVQKIQILRRENISMSQEVGSNIILQPCQVWIKMRPKLQKTL